MPTYEQFVSKIPLFSELPDSYQAHIAEVIREKQLEKNEILFYEEDEAAAIYFVKSGKIRISKSSSDGKEIILTIRQPGEVFAEVAIFNDKATFPATAKAIEDTTVLYVQNEDLEQALRLYPDMSISLFRIMGDRLRKSQSTLRDVALYGKLGAFASTLLRLAEEYGVETNKGTKINLLLTHQELGNFFGATRESVNRMINNLKRDEIVDVDKGYVTIIDEEKLRSYI